MYLEQPFPLRMKQGEHKKWEKITSTGTFKIMADESFTNA